VSYNYDGGTPNTTRGGGGIYVSNSDLTLSQGAVVSWNSSASSNGGGIFLWEKSNFTMESGSEISNNTAGSSGGGVYFLQQSVDNKNTPNPSYTFRMEGGTISNNKVNGTAKVRGGGVFAQCPFYMSGDSKIIGNTCTTTAADRAAQGGGVCIVSYVFTMSDGEISNNSVTGTSTTQGPVSGGGVFIEYSDIGTFIMKKGLITNNTVENTAGGPPFNVTGIKQNQIGAGSTGSPYTGFDRRFVEDYAGGKVGQFDLYWPAGTTGKIEDATINYTAGGPNATPNGT
jgi:hypothetical protein